MSSPVDAQEFTDFATHQHMWEAFTKFAFRGVVATVLVILFLGWITGVL